MYKVLAHSVTIKDRCEVAKRVVLVDRGNEYVVWYETFNEDDNTKHSGYHQGSYFTKSHQGKDALVRAYREFNDRSEVQILGRIPMAEVL